jgi:hypothetical protein
MIIRTKVPRRYTKPGDRRAQGHAPDVYEEHLWVAGCEVLLDPAQLTKFLRETRSEYPRDRTTHRKHWPSIEGPVVILDVFCRRCRAPYGRHEDLCAPWSFVFDGPAEEVAAAHAERERRRDRRLSRKVAEAMAPRFPDEFPPDQTWDDLTHPLDEGDPRYGRIVQDHR